MAGQVKPERKNVKLHVATVVKKDTGRTCALDRVTIAIGSYASSTSSGSDDDDDDDDDGNNAQVLPQQTTGVGALPASANNDNSEGEDNDDSDDDSDEDPPDMFSHYSSDDERDSDDECPPSTQCSRRVTINVPDKVVSHPKANVDTSAGVGAATSAGVDMSAIRPRRSAGVGRTSPSETGTSKNQAEPVPNMERVKDEEEDTAHGDNDVESEMNERYGERNRDGLRPRKPRSYAHRYGPESFEETMATFDEPMGELFLTEQMSLKKGLKCFGKAGAKAVMKELNQLDMRKTIEPVQP
jgi:hypothetical protein